MNLYVSILHHLGVLLLITALVYFIDWYKVLYFIVDRCTAVFKMTWALLMVYFTYLNLNNPEQIERLIALHVVLFAVLFGKNRRKNKVIFHAWLEKLKTWIFGRM